MWTKRWVGLRPLHYPAPPKSRRSYTSSSLILHLWASAALIRLPASEAEGQDRRVQRPAANAVLTTVVDTWGRFWTPRCLSRSSGPLRWAVVDLCGPGHSPEKRTVEDQCRSAVTAGAPMAAISLSWRRRAECLPRGTWSGSRTGTSGEGPANQGGGPLRAAQPARASLSNRAIPVAAALVPAAAHPLGDPRRHPRGLPQPRLRHHLLAQTSQPLTLLGVLSRTGHGPGMRRGLWGESCRGGASSGSPGRKPPGTSETRYRAIPSICARRSSCKTWTPSTRHEPASLPRATESRTPALRKSGQPRELWVVSVAGNSLAVR